MDESESNSKLDPDTYILAAAVIDDDTAAHARQLMEPLRPPGQRKLHWHAESVRSRQIITRTIVGIDTIHVVVVRNGTPGESSERRRRKCFERLAYELDDAYGVQLITAESREKKANAREVQHLGVLRAQQVIGSGMRLYHVPGPAEPLLWIPDAVAGAITAQRTGESQFYDLLAGQIDLIEIGP